MKKDILWFMLPFVVVAVIISGKVAHSRIIGTNPTGASADALCAGGRVSSSGNGVVVISTSEVCIDAGGNVIPTTTGFGSLGTPALKWQSLQAQGATFYATISGASSATFLAGNITGGGIVVPDTVTASSWFHLFPIATTSTLVNLVITTGTYITVQDSVGTIFGTCMSTGSGSAGNTVFVSSNASPASGFKPWAPCHN